MRNTHIHWTFCFRKNSLVVRSRTFFSKYNIKAGIGRSCMPHKRCCARSLPISYLCVTFMKEYDFENKHFVMGEQGGGSGTDYWTCCWENVVWCDPDKPSQILWFHAAQTTLCRLGSYMESLSFPCCQPGVLSCYSWPPFLRVHSGGRESSDPFPIITSKQTIHFSCSKAGFD